MSCMVAAIFSIMIAQYPCYIYKIPIMLYSLSRDFWYLYHKLQALCSTTVLGPQVKELIVSGSE